MECAKDPQPLGGMITEERTDDALRALKSVMMESVPVKSLLPRMWELRNNVSGYDAAYVAAAEIHRCPLVTANARLTRASGFECEVRLALPSQTG